MSLVIYGAGHLGRQVLHHIRHYCPGEKILGYVDDTRPEGEAVIDDFRTLGGLVATRENPAYSPDSVRVVFAIGYADMKGRAQALRTVLESGYSLFDVIHPRASLEPGTQHGPGSIVLAGAIVDQNVTMGAGCFVDIGVRLGENSVVGANNYFSSGAAIGGSVTVGNDCFFGMDCTVTTGVSVGSHCFINAKSLVARTVGDDTKLVEIHKSREVLHQG